MARLLATMLFLCHMAVTVFSQRYKIDSGSTRGFTDLNHQLWQSDRYTWGSFVRSVKSGTITGAAFGQRQMYLSEDYGTSFGYNLPVPRAGAYLIELHFAELYWDMVGARIFDIHINGQARTIKYDIYAVTRKNFASSVKHYQIYTNTRSIHIMLIAKVNFAQICGIGIQPGNISLIPPPVPHSPPPRSPPPLAPPTPEGPLTKLPFASSFMVDYNSQCVQPYNGDEGVILQLAQGSCSRVVGPGLT